MRTLTEDQRVVLYNALVIADKRTAKLQENHPDRVAVKAAINVALAHGFAWEIGDWTVSTTEVTR